MKKIAIIQARMGSARFPGKVLELLQNKPVLEWVVTAAKQVPTIHEVVVATSTAETDQAIVKWCEQFGISVFSGNEEDVLSRYYEASSSFKADIVMRIKSDLSSFGSDGCGSSLAFGESRTCRLRFKCHDPNLAKWS